MKNIDFEYEVSDKKYAEDEFVIKELKDKCVLITGGGSGIGYSICEKFIRASARVVIAGRNEERLVKSCMNIRKQWNDSNINYFKLDIADINNIPIRLKEIEEKFGEVEILINCAGVTLSDMNFDIATKKAWDTVFAINLKGTFFMCQALSELMYKNRINGKIINIGSNTAFRNMPHIYAMSKCGIVNLTKQLSLFLSTYNISINGIAPGPIKAGMCAAIECMRPDSPNGRAGRAEEIANLALLMTSSVGGFIAGETIICDGGEVL